MTRRPSVSGVEAFGKIVFLDCEFTGEHAATTLISVGMVTLDGAEFYLTLSDYDRAQVTPWVRRHVLSAIDESEGVSGREACDHIFVFLSGYAKGERVSLISAGKLVDLTLVFQLWHTQFPGRPYFHFGECLPSYLNHRGHLDLDTLFWAAGFDPSISRHAFCGEPEVGPEHNALEDARVVRKCFLKLMEEANFGR